MTAKKILVLYAHPSHHRSEVNVPLFDVAERIDGVTAIDLYREYPTFNIDIEREQERIKEHDIIIFQFPLFWYSTPAILKEWQDLVLEYGFAYGRKGIFMKDKLFFCTISAGGMADAYQTDGYLHFSIRELLAPIEQMARLTGMIYLPPFVLFGSRTAAEENRIDDHVTVWRRLLRALMEDKVCIDAATESETLNVARLILGEAV